MGKALSSIIGVTCNFDSRCMGWDMETKTKNHDLTFNR